MTIVQFARKLHPASAALLLAIGIFGTSATLAHHPEDEHASAQPSDLNQLTTEQLVALRKTSNVYIYDANSAAMYAKNHIPGAIFIPFNKVSADKLPADRHATLVFYCHSPMCTSSPAAARAASALGYTKVYHFPEGITGWMQAGQKTEP